MKQLYKILRNVLVQFGYNVAEWGLDEERPQERTLKIELVQQSQVEPCFSVYQASFNIVFLNGDWAENATNLSNALTTLIPMEDRQDMESKRLSDNTSIISLLEPPQFSEISVQYNEDTAEEQHTVLVTIHYEYNI